MSDLSEAVAQARRPEIVEAVHQIYAHLEAAIAARRPRCDASGRCCHFETYGHRLYSTTAELATLLEDLDKLGCDSGNQQAADVSRVPGPCKSAPAEIPRLTLPLAPDPGSCPLLKNKLCSIHPLRPFGCRIFFCDPTADDWMRDQYEHHLALLKSLHERFQIPYHYVEWRQALQLLGVTPR